MAGGGLGLIFSVWQMENWKYLRFWSMVCKIIEAFKTLSCQNGKIRFFLPHTSGIHNEVLLIQEKKGDLLYINVLWRFGWKWIEFEHATMTWGRKCIFSLWDLDLEPSDLKSHPVEEVHAWYLHNIFLRHQSINEGLKM